MAVTRRQHHVWRSYLEAWATGGKIYCLRDGKIFNPNVINVAVQRDFYKLHTLTDADVQFIQLFFKDSPSVAKLNIELQRALNPPGEIRIDRFGWTFCPGDKVMQVENNYDKDVYNGDLGRRVSHRHGRRRAPRRF